MKDRNVQYPNRYRDKLTGNVLELEPMPGDVTEAGTPLNKATLLSDRTAEGLSLADDTATVNMAIRRTNLSSFMAFCGANLDAALGKGNESRLFGIGRQLAMYAWFMGETAAFPALIKCETLEECYQYAITEVLSSPSIVALLDTSEYASANFYTESNIAAWKRSYAIMSKLVTVPTVVDRIRENHWSAWAAGWQNYTARGSVSFRVPAGVTCLTVEAVGAGEDGIFSTSARNCPGGAGGKYQLAVLQVTPGQVISGSISDTGTVFGVISLGKGGGAPGGESETIPTSSIAGKTPEQTGKFLKVSAGGRTTKSCASGGGGGGGYGGGNGGGGGLYGSGTRSTGGIGSAILPITEGTGGAAGAGTYAGTGSYASAGNGGGGGGGGGGRTYSNAEYHDAGGGSGGGGYGGGGGGACLTDRDSSATVSGGKGGSGCIVIYM